MQTTLNFRLLCILLFISCHISAQPTFIKTFTDSIETGLPTILPASANNIALTYTIRNPERSPVLYSLAHARLDEMGNVKWSARYRCEYSVISTTAANARNGNYLVAGNFFRDDSMPKAETYLLRLSANGDLMYSRGFPGRLSIPANIIEQSTGDIILVCGSPHAQDSGADAVVLWLRPDGSLIQSRLYPDMGVYPSAVLLPDGHLLLWSMGSAMRITPGGNVAEKRHYTALEGFRTRQFMYRQDTRILAVLSREDGAPASVLIQLDQHGWPAMASPMQPNTEYTGITENMDGELLVAGNYLPEGKRTISQPALFRHHPATLRRLSGGLPGTGAPGQTAGILVNDSGCYLTGMLMRPGYGRSFFVAKTNTGEPGPGCLSKMKQAEGEIPVLDYLTLPQTVLQAGMKDRGLYKPRVKNTLLSLTLCEYCEPPRPRLPDRLTLCADSALVLKPRRTTGKFTWSDGSNAPELTVTEHGKYWVKIENQCGSGSDTVIVLPPPILEPVFSISNASPQPDSLIILTDITHKADGLKRHWIIGDSVLTDTGRHIRLAFHRNGRHPVILSITDTFGCVHTGIQWVTVSLQTLYLPNAFTPGKDGLNETFGPKGFGIDTYQLKIFNRWGEMIFDEPNKDWDGRFGGESVPRGIYYYLIQIRQDDGRVRLIKGSVWVMGDF